MGQMELFGKAALTRVKTALPDNVEPAIKTHLPDVSIVIPCLDRAKPVETRSSEPKWL